MHRVAGCTWTSVLSGCSLSKQVFLQDPSSPHELPDGTSAYADFTGSKNQRYATPDAAAKNHILEMS